MELKERAKKLILRNYALSGKKYIAPDAFHKDQWLWDSCFHAIVCAELGLKDLAKNEINRLLKWQREDGWLPHQIYKNPGKGWQGIERILYKKEDGYFHSSITQPPVLAQAVEAIDDPEWTQKILPKLVKFYLYFAEKCDPDGDGLISVCLPTETGRDSAPEFDIFRPRLSGDNKASRLLDFLLSRLHLYWVEFNYKRVGWNIRKIWQKDLFNVEDLMFHCIWADGLRSLCRLSGQKYIGDLADKAENAVYQRCWSEKDKIFYSLDSNNRKIKRKTISNLFPLILENVPSGMRRALMGHLTNPEEFWTPYPIPSAAKNDSGFDPRSEFHCNWRGPVWVNTNWFIIRGMIKHGFSGEIKIAREIAEKTLLMVEREGFREFYNPFSGKGLREASRGFGWSALAITFPGILEKEKRE